LKWLCELLVIERCGEQFLVLDDHAEPEGRPIRKLFGILRGACYGIRIHDYSSCWLDL